MKYKKSLMTVMAVAMLGLSGCAENQIPEMTEEEMRAVGEYVAYALTKYDAGRSSRLMDLPPIEEESKAPPERRRPRESSPRKRFPTVRKK